MRKLADLAAKRIIESRFLLFTAGSGMGVDSGLPTFRCDDGFWKNYPAFKKLDMPFRKVASPLFFYNNPEQYWYFYGHRYNLYNKAKPHDGFRMLLEIGKKVVDNNYFVYTTNVDGHFQRAGFPSDRIVEFHGSINHCQCRPCFEIMKAPFKEIEIDEARCVAKAIPRCAKCKAILRPNIMMFNDYDWIRERTKEQLAQFTDFVEKNTSHVLRNSLTIIEVGAGSDLPTIRRFGEMFLTEPRTYKTTLIRINAQDLYCNLGDIHEIDENNINKVPEAYESREEFLEKLEKTREKDRDNSISKRPVLIGLKTTGLEGIKLIYEAIKRYSPKPF